MSVDATRWAWMQRDISSTQKIILLTLADRANEYCKCFPSVKRIETDTCLDKKAIYRAISALEKKGLISIERREGLASVYTLLGVDLREDTYPQNGSTPFGDNPFRGQPQKGLGVTPKGVRGVTPKGVTNLKVEPNNNLKENKEEEGATLDNDILLPVPLLNPKIPMIKSNLEIALIDFEEMRKKIKKPLTERAKELVLKKLETMSGGDTDCKIKILEQSIMNCWQGIFELKEDFGNARNENGYRKPPPSTRAQYDKDVLDAQAHAALAAGEEIKRLLAEEEAQKEVINGFATNH